jgi:hypothetical protein
MATAVIGGLLTSTMLTLLVIPVVYTLLDDLVARFWGQGPRRAKRVPAPEPEEREPYPLRDLPFPEPARDTVRRMEGDAAGGG